MGESNFGEADDAHVGIGKLENALREEDEPDRKPDQQDARGTLGWSKEEAEKRVHGCDSDSSTLGRCSYRAL
jgi:hypothetical protein